MYLVYVLVYLVHKFSRRNGTFQIQMATTVCWKIRIMLLILYSKLHLPQLLKINIPAGLLTQKNSSFTQDEEGYFLLN